MIAKIFAKVYKDEEHTWLDTKQFLKLKMGRFS